MYRFYFNVDSGEFAQIYCDGEMTDEFCFEELDRLAGVWSDCYMPVCLAVDVFGRDMALPFDMNDKTAREWLEIENTTSCIYPAQENDALFGQYYPGKVINKNRNINLGYLLVPYD